MQEELRRRGGKASELSHVAGDLERQLREASDALAALALKHASSVKEKAAAEQDAAAARAEAQRDAAAAKVSKPIRALERWDRMITLNVCDRHLDLHLHQRLRLRQEKEANACKVAETVAALQKVHLHGYLPFAGMRTNKTKFTSFRDCGRSWRGRKGCYKRVSPRGPSFPPSSRTRRRSGQRP